MTQQKNPTWLAQVQNIAGTAATEKAETALAKAMTCKDKADADQALIADTLGAIAAKMAGANDSLAE